MPYQRCHRLNCKALINQNFQMRNGSIAGMKIAQRWSGVADPHSTVKKREATVGESYRERAYVERMTLVEAALLVIAKQIAIQQPKERPSANAELFGGHRPIAVGRLEYREHMGPFPLAQRRRFRFSLQSLRM